MKTFLHLQPTVPFLISFILRSQPECWDFSRILSNREICNKTLIRSFNSARIVTDTLMLHSLYTNPTNTLLTIQLMQNSVSFSRFPNKIVFHDLSRKRIGKNSFGNCAKYISELIPYEWVTINSKTFRHCIKTSAPIFIQWYTHLNFLNSTNISSTRLKMLKTSKNCCNF